MAVVEISREATIYEMVPTVAAQARARELYERADELRRRTVARPRLSAGPTTSPTRGPDEALLSAAIDYQEDAEQRAREIGWDEGAEISATTKRELIDKVPR